MNFSHGLYFQKFPERENTCDEAVNGGPVPLDI